VTAIGSTNTISCVRGFSYLTHASALLDPTSARIVAHQLRDCSRPFDEPEAGGIFPIDQRPSSLDGADPARDRASPPSIPTRLSRQADDAVVLSPDRPVR